MPAKPKAKPKKAKTNTAVAKPVVVTRVEFKIGSDWCETLSNIESCDAEGQKLEGLRKLNDDFSGFVPKSKDGLFFQREGCDDVFFIHKDTLAAINEIVQSA